jgi:deoxyribodipyrimidine photo-lyase
MEFPERATRAVQGMSHSWQLGAALFEALLVDHDWAINMGNWAYNAGVGNDPRDRIFRTVSQGMMYDPQAELIKAWVPELHQLSDTDAHQPWALVGSDAAADIVNTTYPPPLLNVSTQVAVNRGKRL